MHDIQTPPRTIMEVFKMLPEGTLAELIEGTIYMSPAPTPGHQRVIRELALELSAFVKKNRTGEILFAPCDVFLDESSNAVQPDIIYIARGNDNIVKEDSIHGVPDLLVEILSKGNSRHDLVLKKALYQKFGVKEYWIIDPDTKEVSGFTLENGIYKALEKFTGKIQSPLLKGEFPF